MKRWNFSGQRQSHGNTKAHRRLGSIGQRTYPGKVWKGKKMPGRMGGETVTYQNKRIMKIDCPKSLIYIRGQVPGPVGGCVYICDSMKKRERQFKKLSYPTFIPRPDEEYPDILLAPVRKLDPSEMFKHENNLEGIKHQTEEIDEMVVDETGTIVGKDDTEI